MNFMDSHIFGVHFSDILMTFNCNTTYLVLAIVFTSLILYYCLKREKSFEDSRSNHQSSGLKKKGKKKLNTLKASRNSDFLENESEEIQHEIRHIEIKNSPEILNEEISLHHDSHPLSSPGKPILRKSDDVIFINKEECLENVWTKIPKDEVEILRSRHSSVVSLAHLEYKDDGTRAETKLSRGQKKRLKAKLKTSDIKQNETKNHHQLNNSAVLTFPNENIKNSVHSSVNDDSLNKAMNDQKNDTHLYTKTASLTSTDSSQISEKMKSFSSAENDENFLSNNFEENLQSNTFDQNIDEFHFQPFLNDFNDSEDKANLEHEIKELKEERYNMLQKLNEFPAMVTKFNALKKENDLYLKKNDDMERTCNVLKQELASSMQKHVSTEGQLARFKADINQQRAYYENEISKFSNTIKMLENEKRSKTVEYENLKNNYDKLQFVVMEKDKHMQIQNNEVSSIKEQLFITRKDCQDRESQIKNSSLKLNESENQKQLAYEETQKTHAQVEIMKKEINRVQKELEKFKHQAKAQERQQDSIISSLQYQLDENRREKQQSLFLNSELENKKTAFRVSEKQTNNDNYTTLSTNENKLRLQEKCDHLESIINEYQRKEANLEDQNSRLSDSYSKLNDEFEGHLKEIITLRHCIETLQGELSKNSETSPVDLKLELDDKTETLRNTQDILAKLESSISEKETKWRDSCNANLKLENELKSQASLVKSQHKKISELTLLLQTYNHSQNESKFNGSLS